MAHSVLLVEPDINALGELAEGLRTRGLQVLLADSIDGALQRLEVSRVDALLIAESLLADPNVEAAIEARPAVARLPRWALVPRTADANTEAASLPHHDPEVIARHILSIPTQAPIVSVARGDFRGNLKHVSVSDLLQLLNMNHRTGTLTLVTPTGQGEVRLADGEIADAVFRRVEGTKALYRLLVEVEGTFSFIGGSARRPRRVTEPTHLLLLEGMRHGDEIRQVLERLSANEDALQTAPLLDACAPPSTDLERLVLMALEVPRIAADLLDDLSYPDLDILNTVESLLARGAVRRIPQGAVRVELADPEQLSVLSAIVRQLKHPGFLDNPRLVIFSTPTRLAGCLHALNRIADALALTDAVPSAPVAHRLTLLRLADGQDLEIVALPNNLAYAPLWNLTLLGSSAVVTLGTEHSELLEEAAQLASVRLLDAETLLGHIDESDPRQIAALVRATLEAAAGR